MRSEHKKTGQSCNYNVDCLSESCISGKCGGLGVGEVCSDSSGIRFKACESGLYCAQHIENSAVNYKCSKLIVTVGTQISDDTTCGVGFYPDKDSKCQKLVSLEDGVEVGDADERLCK